MKHQLLNYNYIPSVNSYKQTFLLKLNLSETGDK